MRYNVYLCEVETAQSRTQNDSAACHWQLWRPTLGNLRPDGLGGKVFLVWWLMHHLHLFANRDYSLLLVYHAGKLSHRSCVFPRYFRFPFMAKQDLQIGDTWTDENHRGKGLATFALRCIVENLRQPGRRFWYVTSEDNIASIRACEKAGFRQVATSRRTSRLGTKWLGAFVLEP